MAQPMKKAHFISYLPEIMTLHGVYPISDNSSPFSRVFISMVRYYTQFQHILSITLCVLFPIHVENFGEHVNELAICITWCLIYTNASLNLFYYKYFEEKAKEIHLYIEDNFPFQNEENTRSENTTMAFSIKFGNIITFIWHFMVYMVCFSAILIPFINEGRSLPIPAWFPYPWQESPYFELTYAFQVVGLLNLGSSYPTYDLFYSHCMICTVAQFKILELNLKNIVPIALLNYGLPKEDVELFNREFNRYGRANLDDNELSENNLTKKHKMRDIYKLFEDEKFNKVLMETFGKYIDQYQMIAHLCKNLKEFFGPGAFIKIISVSTTICFLAFAIVITDDRIWVISMFITLLLAITLPLFTCGLGAMLQEANVKLLQALHEVPWYICNRKFRTTYIILQARVLYEPIKITAWRILDIDLNTYVNIIKTAFSYYTVLRQLTPYD